MKYDLEKLKLELPELKDFNDESIIKGLDVEMEHEDITKGDLTVTARIALTHLKEDPAYYTKLEKIEKQNAKQKPKIYYARHIEKGLVGYNEENLFIDDDSLKKMNPTFGGCPVYVLHQAVDISKIEEESDGYVAESFYNKADGWHWLKFIAVSDKIHEKIAEGWGVSNAYVPTDFGQGGDWHNLAYDRKVLNGYYTHLAIVPDPRYEDAKIYTPEEFRLYNEKKKEELKELQNSKKEKNGGLAIMFFKNKKVKETVELEKTTDLTGVMMEVNGQEIAVTDMISAVEMKNAKDEEAKKKDEEKINADSEVEVGGKKMTVKELVNEYKAMCDEEKKNQDDEEEKKKKEDEEKENESDEDKAKKEEEEKKNALELAKKAEEKRVFDELQNAHKNKTKTVRVETSNNKEQRGASRYGSSN